MRIPSYGSIYALGHKAVEDIFKDAVVIEEKVDGSQFSFGVRLVAQEDGSLTRELSCRSKGAELQVFAPDNMFKRGVEIAKDLIDDLTPGWTYRAEYLQKPRHNSLTYNRVPNQNSIIFDIDCGLEDYMTYEQKEVEARRLGFEVAPLVFYGIISDPQQIRDLLDRESILGGQKVEGLVIKNYQRFGVDKKMLMAKFVSEAFKEVHAVEWKKSNPTGTDIIQDLGLALKTPARWAKAVMHLREQGKIQDAPQDIGLLFKEVPADILKEEVDMIKDRLFSWAWPKISRIATSGLPEWYKDQLLAKQFEETPLSNLVLDLPIAKDILLEDLLGFPHREVTGGDTGREGEAVDERG